MMIEIDVVGKRIHLTSPYSPHTIASCKRVGGANWSKKARAWTFPLSVESCLRLRAEFGRELKVREALSHWYREEIEKRQALANLNEGGGAVELPRLKEEAPVLHEAVTLARPFQSRGAKFIVDGRNVLIADDPGLGKTLETMAGIVESGVPGPYIIVSPKTAATAVWPRMIQNWLPGHQVITIPEGKAKREAAMEELIRLHAKGEGLDKLWISVHPEMLLVKSYWRCEKCGEDTPWTTKPTPILDCDDEKTKQTKIWHDTKYPALFWMKFGAAVVDECHEMLIRKSGTPTQRRRGLELLAVREDGLRIALSGTPSRNKPWQLWGTLNWLRPKVYTGFWRWADQYWTRGGFSGWDIQGLIPEREQMLWSELGSIMLRRTKGEVASDLPPKTYVGTPYVAGDATSPVGIWLPMHGAQKKAYDQMAADSAAELTNGRIEATGVLAELTRLSQFANAYGSLDEKGEFMPNLPSNKMEWLENFLEELGIPKEPTAKVVVVSRFTRMLKMASFGLAAAQGGMSCMLTGEVSGGKREAMIDDFNMEAGSDSPHIMFLQVKAGGVAITIDSADHMVLLDESDKDTMTQVEDRIHRVSKPRPVNYYYLRSLETVDVGTAVVNAELERRGHRLMDGRRGVEYMRQVMAASRA